MTSSCPAERFNHFGRSRSTRAVTDACARTGVARAKPHAATVYAQGDPGARILQEATNAPWTATLAQVNELLVETLKYLPERRSVGYELDFGPVTVPAGNAVLELRSRIAENLDALRTAMTPNPAAATDG